MEYFDCSTTTVPVLYCTYSTDMLIFFMFDSSFYSTEASSDELCTLYLFIKTGGRIITTQINKWEQQKIHTESLNERANSIFFAGTAVWFFLAPAVLLMSGMYRPASSLFCFFKEAWTGLWNKEEQQWKIKGKKKQQKKSLTYRGEERDKIKNNSGKKNDLNIYGIETKEEKTKTPFNSFDTYSHRWSQLSFFFIIFCEVLPQCGAYRLVCLLVVLKAINWLFRANK